MSEGKVLVQVVPAQLGTEIGWGRPTVAEELEERVDDIRGAIRSGTAAVAESLKDLPRPDGWRVGEVSASFGLALTAEAGVVLTKASVGVTFEVTVTFTSDA